MKAPNFLSEAWKNGSATLHLVLIFLAVALVWGITCGWWSLTGAEETVSIYIAREWMANAGLMMTLDGEAYNQNPPFAFWLFAMAIKIFGGINSINSLPRLFVVAFGFIMLVCTYFCGRKLLNPKAALYGAFILATCPVFMFNMPKVGLDIIFAALVTISITAIITRKEAQNVGLLRFLAIWLALILACLTKGPLAFIIIFAFMVLYALAHGTAFLRVFKNLRFIPGFITFLVIIGSMLFIGYHQWGIIFVQQQLQLSTMQALLIDIISRPVWYYFTHILQTMGVWAIGLAIAVIMVVRHSVKFMPYWYLWLFWFLPGFLLLSLLKDKNVAYLLPVLPPLVLFIGYYLAQLTEKMTASHTLDIISWLVRRVLTLAGIIVCLASAVSFLMLDLPWSYGFYITLPGLILAFAVGLILILLGCRNRYAYASIAPLFGVVVITLLLGNLFVNGVINPAIDVHRTGRYFSRNLAAMYPEITFNGLAVIADGDGVTQDLNSSRLHIYGDYITEKLTFAPDMFAGVKAMQLPDYILMSAEEFARLSVRPELGGFAPVYWDLVENRYEVILLQRQTQDVIYPNAPMPLIYVSPQPLLLAYAPENAPGLDEIGTPYLPGEHAATLPPPRNEPSAEVDAGAAPPAETALENAPAATGDDAAPMIDAPAEASPPDMEPAATPENTADESDAGAVALDAEAAITEAADNAETLTGNHETPPAATTATEPATSVMPPDTADETPLPADNDANESDAGVVALDAEAAITEAAADAEASIGNHETPPAAATATEPAVSVIPSDTADETPLPADNDATESSSNMGGEAATPAKTDGHGEAASTEPPLTPTPESSATDTEEVVEEPVADAPAAEPEPIRRDGYILMRLLGPAEAWAVTDTEMPPAENVAEDTVAALPGTAGTDTAATDSVVPDEPPSPTEIWLKTEMDGKPAADPAIKTADTVGILSGVTNKPRMVILNRDKCVVPQGLLQINGELHPYLSNCGGQAAYLLDITTYQPNLTRFFSINMAGGFQNNAYALNWLSKAGANHKARYNMLMFANADQMPAASWPYTQRFTRWAARQIKAQLSPQAVFYLTGQPNGAATLNAVTVLGDLANPMINDDEDFVSLLINFELTQTVLEAELRDGETKKYELLD